MHKIPIKTMIDEERNDANKLIDLAYNRIDLKDLRGAEELLDRVPAPSREGKYFEAMAAVRVAAMEYDKGAEFAQKAVSLGWNTPRVKTLLAKCHNHMGLYRPTKASVEPANAQDAYFRAGLAYRDGDYAVAVSLAKKTIELSPSFSRADSLRLASEAALGDSTSLSLLRARWQDRSDDSALLYLLADAERRKAYEEVDLYVEGALSHPELDTNLLARIARLYILGQRPREAIDFLSKAPEALVLHSKIDLIRGEAFLKMGRQYEALPFLQRAFDAEPSGRWEAKRLFRTQMKSKAWRGALRTLATYIRAVRRRS